MDKLNQLEKLVRDITTEQEKISAELAELRKCDKEKTVKFRQLFSKKLSNATVMDTLQNYKLM